MLELRGLVCRYGKVTAVKGLSLEVGRGQLVALIGTNGAGKSTTLRAISGLLPAAAGSIVFEGTDITHASARKILSLGVAHCPEGRHVFPYMTVTENLEMGCYLRADRRDIMQDMDRLFEQFPRLAERRQQQAGTLSGGEQQMLAIARALLNGPKLLMLDEPVEGLAPVVVEEIVTQIRDIRSSGIPILLVEQNLAVCIELADRHYILELGRVVYQGSREQFIADATVKDRYLGVGS